MSGESAPHREVKSKNFIPKVMFLAPIARPRRNPSGNGFEFDGEIGIWPFVVQEPAKRSSRNRVRGTLVTKPINVSKEVFRSYLLEKMIPEIVRKWPVRREQIRIQLYNARPHISTNDPDFIEATRRIRGLSINLVRQPPNSPDVNVLDLGFFRSIQTLCDEEDPRNIHEMIQGVVQKFYEYNPELIDNVFLTLQNCMIEILKNGGSNDYKIPHLGKQKLRNQGILPVSLVCPRGVL
ncbi:MAG: hypothetical protein ACO2Z3_06685 [Flavobacteriaceae bacterium]